MFDQEIGLIRTRQRWLVEEPERLEGQLEDLRLQSTNAGFPTSGNDTRPDIVVFQSRRPPPKGTLR